MHTFSGLSVSKKAFLASVKNGKIPPLYTEIPYTEPAQLYPSLSGPMSFILESVKGPLTTSRFSFIGFQPYITLKAKDGKSEVSSGLGSSTCSEHPLKTLRNLMENYSQLPCKDLPPFQGGAAGLLSYDFVHYLERLPITTLDDIQVPDAHIIMIDRLVAFDHLEKKAWVIVCPGARSKNEHHSESGWAEHFEEAEDVMSDIIQRLVPAGKFKRPRQNGARIEVIHEMTEKQYSDMVLRVKEYIAAGDIFQANISLRVAASIGKVNPWDLYMILRDINPSPFAGFFDFGDYCIVSSSPERLIMLRDGMLETRPIAGTRPRGGTKAENTMLRNELLLNEKERAEHIMLIDLERNDMGRVCDYGSIKVNELMITEEYSHVMHIVSNIRGRLAKGKNAIDAIKATFPGGTITGVPKIRCMEIIDELEPVRRGPYTGSAGYIGFSGNMDLNIIIRTFLIKNGMAYVQAGAGIVSDSEPPREYQESLKKAEALIRALESAG